MIVLRADDAANERELVRHLRHQRQVLADFDAGNVRLDRLELAADFRRRIHLQIERVLVRRPARQINHDDRFVRSPDAGRRFRLEKFRQRRAAQGKPANLEKIPPR